MATKHTLKNPFLDGKQCSLLKKLGSHLTRPRSVIQRSNNVSQQKTIMSTYFTETVGYLVKGFSCLKKLGDYVDAKRFRQIYFRQNIFGQKIV